MSGHRGGGKRCPSSAVRDEKSRFRNRGNSAPLGGNGSSMLTGGCGGKRYCRAQRRVPYMASSWLPYSRYSLLLMSCIIWSWETKK
ncbi:hypothetical protein EYF80_015679 [Liparis tanakae]|uniref:Uncharacterized protein n=1 Tax=Liparis tanakae TaxID=230148 RepID=A0A4Z2I7W7_9TELE|nr:hypothetical protein EYF80_015679 [Liparis tanakae]